MATHLYAHEIGEGLPILIIHGWEMDGRVEELDFEPVFSEIPGLHRIYVDLPGMGRTPANGIKSQDDIFARLTHFVESRLGTSRFLVVGSSLGGHLARALAQKYAGQVDGLVLRVPLMEPDDNKRDLDTFAPLVQNKQLMSSTTAEERALLGNVLIQKPDYVELLKTKYKGAYSRAESAADSEVLNPIRANPMRYGLSNSCLNDNDKFFAPTLIICGRQDPVVGHRDSLRLLELCPRSTFAVIDRGSHDLPVDQNGLFEALVRDWIARVHEWRAIADE